MQSAKLAPRPIFAACALQAMQCLMPFGAASAALALAAARPWPRLWPVNSARKSAQPATKHSYAWLANLPMRRLAVYRDAAVIVGFIRIVTTFVSHAIMTVPLVMIRTLAPLVKTRIQNLMHCVFVQMGFIIALLQAYLLVPVVLVAVLRALGLRIVQAAKRITQAWKTVSANVPTTLSKKIVDVSVILDTLDQQNAKYAIFPARLVMIALNMRAQAATIRWYLTALANAIFVLEEHFTWTINVSAVWRSALLVTSQIHALHARTTHCRLMQQDNALRNAWLDIFSPMKLASLAWIFANHAVLQQIAVNVLKILCSWTTVVNAIEGLLY
jgi:hypothetical protein